MTDVTAKIIKLLSLCAYARACEGEGLVKFTTYNTVIVTLHAQARLSQKNLSRNVLYFRRYKGRFPKNKARFPKNKGHFPENKGHILKYNGRFPINKPEVLIRRASGR